MTNLQKFAKEYAKFKVKQDALDAEKARINEKVYAEMKKTGITSATFNEGILGIVPKTEWTFTKAVEKKQKELEVLKEKEKESGKAKKEIVSESVRFTPKKVK